ncbi:MAG: hypothetical protein GF416_02520 [Candidatus Altiarchaeales archaeon]|nr:hypothetical protein [Candidatus Altiarchaeales archaeon]MBD3415993.1 hypothetical protein [Candidatus Altiarchaeales archaeon]
MWYPMLKAFACPARSTLMLLSFPCDSFSMGVEVFYFGVAVVIGGLLLFYRGFRWFRENQLIHNTPTSKVRSMAMGRVELYGTIESCPKKEVKTPFSGLPCVWCKWVVEERRSYGDDKKWTKVKEGVLNGLFYLRDETGKVMVYPKNADVDVPQFREYSNRMFGSLPQGALSFLEGRGLKTSGLFGSDRTFRLTEYFLMPGDEVYVLGTARDNPLVEDGTSDINEEDIIVCGGEFFYISRRPLKDVHEYHAAKVITGFGGGILLTLAGVYLMLYYLGIV